MKLGVWRGGVLVTFALLLAAAPPPQQAPAPTVGADARAERLVAQMTREEKLRLVFGYFATDFPSKNYKADPQALQGSAGYVPGIPRLGIPAQWQTDAGVGVATQAGAAKKREGTALPSGLATAATWNPALARAGGAMIGAEAHGMGFNILLAGGVNLLRDPRNGRNFEYAGEDPLLAGVMVGAQIAGIQSQNVVSTVKHFAVNDQETGRNRGNSVLTDPAARLSDLLAFKVAIEQGDPGSVMCSYNRVNGTHACESAYLLTDVLRRDWKYRGYVMSDWGATHSTVAAANAGLDQESGFPFDDEPYFAKPLADAVAAGRVSEARLTQMATRIVRAMVASGLLDRPPVQRPIDHAAHAAVTRADAEEGAVLLKNDRAILPLSPSVRRIAVIGGHADKGVLSGGGSSQVYPIGGNAVPGLEPTGWPGPVMYFPSSPLEAIRRQAPNAQVTFVPAGDLAAAAAAARASDVVLVFATQWTTEGRDVALNLPDNQDALIEAVAAANPRTAVVLETGGPVLTPWAGRVAAILEAWYPGTAGGEAIANLLFGRVNPSGHLPATFPASFAQLPNTHPLDQQSATAGDVTYAEGATVGYKWFDRRNLQPAFAFGHGLSYTRFTYDGLSARAADGGVTVRFRVRNAGRVAGKDVPQVYVAPQTAGAWEAPKRLGGWQKVSLAPGRSQTVEVAVDPRLLATWDEAGHRWHIAGGTYRVMLGASSRDIRRSVSVRVPAATMPAGWSPGDAVR